MNRIVRKFARLHRNALAHCKHLHFRQPLHVAIRALIEHIWPRKHKLDAKFVRYAQVGACAACSRWAQPVVVRHAHNGFEVIARVRRIAKRMQHGAVSGRCTETRTVLHTVGGQQALRPIRWLVLFARSWWRHANLPHSQLLWRHKPPPIRETVIYLIVLFHVYAQQVHINVGRHMWVHHCEIKNAADR